MKYKFALAACARWESPYVVEWLAYYQLLGFDHVFLYCNDDAPEEMYGLVLPFLLGPRPFVTFRHHPVQGEQYWMYVHFLRHHLDECEWIAFLDLDEFIRLPRGQSIGDFVGGFGDAVDCLLFNWLNFGTGGHAAPPPGRVLQNYTKRERELHPFTKFVARASVFKRDWIFDEHEYSAFWHYPEGKTLPGTKLRNVLGEDMADYDIARDDQAKRFINDPARGGRIIATAVIQHYFHRSEVSFRQRVERGLGGAFGGQTLWKNMADSDTFRSYLENINLVPDESLAAFWPEVLSRAARTGTQPEPPPQVAPDGGATNLARGRPATQSSVSQWSRGRTPAEDAAGAVAGRPTGERNFHTGWEEAPWWQVDLGKAQAITEIRIYTRSMPMFVAVSSDSTSRSASMRTASSRYAARTMTPRWAASNTARLSGSRNWPLLRGWSVSPPWGQAFCIWIRSRFMAAAQRRPRSWVRTRICSDASSFTGTNLAIGKQKTILA